MVSKFPNVPTEYLPDFIRGLWDGDGHINNECNVSSFISGSENFIIEMHKNLRANIPEINGRVRVQTIKNGTMMSNNKPRKSDGFHYSIVLKADETNQLGNYMYRNYQNDNAIKMERKYQLFKKRQEITITNKNNEFPDIQQVKDLVKKLGIKSETQWRIYRKNKPDNIPSNPERTYKDKGWNGWTDFLGTQDHKLLDYETAKNYVKKLNIKSINEWNVYIRSPDRLPFLTLEPRRHYRDRGWVNWKDWLGCDNKVKRDRPQTH